MLPKTTQNIILFTFYTSIFIQERYQKKKKKKKKSSSHYVAPQIPCVENFGHLKSALLDITYFIYSVVVYLEKKMLFIIYSKTSVRLFCSCCFLLFMVLGAHLYISLVATAFLFVLVPFNILMSYDLETYFLTVFCNIQAYVCVGFSYFPQISILYFNFSI